MSETHVCGRCGWSWDGGSHITVYQTDKKSGKSSVEEVICEDCDLEERKLEYRKTRFISSRMATEAELRRYYTLEGTRMGQTMDAIHDDLGEIGKLIVGFDNEVWLPGLRKVYLDDDARGMKAEFGKTKVMLYCMAGRVLVQVEQEDGQFVSMITTDEDKPRPLGRQGIGCTLTAAVAMFAEVTARYKSGLMHISRDDDINMGF